MTVEMSTRERHLRQFLRSSCDNLISAPDLQIVCKDGESFAHKFVVWGFLPELNQLLCESCQNSHEDTKLILPDVSKTEVDMARDFLYMFGDVDPFVKIFGGQFVKKTINSKQGATVPDNFNDGRVVLFHGIE